MARYVLQQQQVKDQQNDWKKNLLSAAKDVNICINICIYLYMYVCMEKERQIFHHFRQKTQGFGCRDRIIPFTKEMF